MLVGKDGVAWVALRFEDGQLTLQAALAAPLPHSDPSSVKWCPPCAHNTLCDTQDSRHSASWGGDVVHLAPHCLLYGGVLWRKGWQVAAMPVRNNQARCSEDKRGSGPGNDGSAAASALTDCHQNRNRCKHPFLLCLCTREPNSPHMFDCII